MTETSPNKYWILIVIILIATIATGSAVIWSKYDSSQPVEISLASGQEWQGMVYVGGAVNNPGSYPVKAGDSIPEIIQIAGGTAGNANLSSLKIYIPCLLEEKQPQKIDLNRAEVWLLEALPGIGEIRAQAIIDYRCQNGAFSNINEITKVDGISITTYEQIKHLITVSDQY